MRAKAIEIRWHNTKSIYSTDFQRTPPSNLDVLLPKKSHPYAKSEHDKLVENYEQQKGFGNVWRLATAGGDNMVMMWLVYPKPTMAQMAHYRTVQQMTTQPSNSAAGNDTTSLIEHQNAPVVEYLATLAKHQGVVNVVRFCPKGEMLASAGDDGNVLLWVLSTSTTAPSTFSENQYDRENWRTRLMLRGPAQCEIYDMAWSPCGDFLLTGDTAKTARIWNVTDGLCIKQITEHTNFVQGVAWDPLGKFIVTQSSDRSMHVYTVQIKREENGGATADVHHVGKNFKLDLFNNRLNSWASQLGSLHSQKDDAPTDQGVGSLQTPAPSNYTPASTPAATSAASSASMAKLPRPQLEPRSISTLTTSTTDSLTTGQNTNHSGSVNRIVSIPPTPSTTTSTQFNEEFMMLPPSEIPHHHHSTSQSQHLRTRSHSRQSSVVSSQTMSPSSMHPMRSPSPVPPLPAIHINEDHRASTVLLYGDEGASAFFRRLSWSLDGSMLITPAGRWEHQQSSGENRSQKGKEKETERRNIHSSGGKRKRKKRSIASTQLGIDSTDDEEHVEKLSGEDSTPTVYIYGRGSIASSASSGLGDYGPLARLPGHKSSSLAIRFSPVFYELNNIRDCLTGSPSNSKPVKVELAKGKAVQQVDLRPSPNVSSMEKEDMTSLKPAGEQTPHVNKHEGQDGVFDLPYRMIYAVATHDTVFVYDTQQSSPICMFGNLHFSSFTDLAWSADGETLILSSSDGYCSLVAFEKNELGTPLSEEACKLIPGYRDRSQENFNHQPTEEQSTSNAPTQTGSSNLGSVAPLSRRTSLTNDAQPSVKMSRPAPEDLNENDRPKKKRVPLTYEGPVRT
ncbi:hypothetical protein CROQUDRAFT_649678 [Cronartium quercuum f. sp. fusiforme G11]|uniref:CAF1B/HIR1 beta-propeller domain-containing protein n=1 Tax=Cronartium quercuum f. sp. fusiforme G11 TaxID=708437 RepID=A0A9P6NUR6_9BASI|nr:hypothetical protein CROQUDRAFT_649678 [Cronartium quercuum f. sp. fusiforme G11]